MLKVQINSELNFEKIGKIVQEAAEEAGRIGYTLTGAEARARQSNTGPTNEPNRTSILRIQTGRNNRSFQGQRNLGTIEREIDVDVKSNGVVETEVTYKVPYTARHEFGFNGVEVVGSYVRKDGSVVRSHTRKANTPARPVIIPAARATERLTADKAGEVMARELQACIDGRRG